MSLRRRDVPRHLPVCPASVVVCTMEWSRWPMYSRGRGARVPFSSGGPRARCGQLDVALALRDQRSLDKARRCPRRSLVRSLRNSFTKRYPAVPLLVGGNPTFVGEAGNAGELSLSDSDDEDFDASSRAPWLTSKEPPGLQRSILGELFCQLPAKSGAGASASAEDVRCALCSKADAIVDLTAAAGTGLHSGSTDTEYGTVCGNAHHRETDKLSRPVSEDHKTLSVADLTECPHPKQAAIEVPHEGVSGTCMHSNFVPATSDARNNSLLSADVNGHASGTYCVASSDVPLDHDTVDASSSVPETESGCDVESWEQASSECAPLTLLHDVLAVDLNVEVCSRYHIRDPSLYSFVCAQLFRRDEYARHVRDVHSVIHDAIDHWLELRCPLAHYGCTFSQHRRLPSGARVVFSTLLESLGLRRTDTAVSGIGESSPAEPVKSLGLRRTDTAVSGVGETSPTEPVRSLGLRRTENTEVSEVGESSPAEPVKSLGLRRTEDTEVSGVGESSPAENRRECSRELCTQLPTSNMEDIETVDIGHSSADVSLGLQRMDTAVGDSSPAEPANRRECSRELPTSNVEDIETVDAGRSSADASSPAVDSVPKEVENLPASSPDRSKEATPEMSKSRQESPEANNTDNLTAIHVDDEIASVENCNPKASARSAVAGENRSKECTPEMFTSTECDSTVCIRPRTSKQATPADDDALRLTGLPYELVSRVAGFLDSFSLCNLALTCWLLRDVCRGLLRQRGLVLQEWQKDCSRNPPRWKVSHQVLVSVSV